MSHNITKWRTKRIEGLILPMAMLYNSTRKDNRPFPPHLADADADLWLIKWSEESWIQGIAEGGDNLRLQVTAIQIQGPWSEHLYFDVLTPAFQQSKGELDAVLTWANGDSINRLLVKDGEIKEESIEL